MTRERENWIRGWAEGWKESLEELPDIWAIDSLNPCYKALDVAVNMILEVLDSKGEVRHKDSMGSEGSSVHQ